jgi:DHA1 family tetracycline resistance protein-like MFS transporter
MLILAVCMGLQTTAFVLIMPLFSRRLSALGAGVEALSLSDMAYALTATLAAPFMGALADRFGRRPLALGSLAAYACAFTGYLLAPSAQVFILLRALTGAFTAGLAPAIYGLIADLAPSDRRAQWISIVCGGASFGWIAGPLVGGLLYDRWGYGIPFGLSIAIAVLTFLLAILTIPETHRAALTGAAQAHKGKHLFQLKNMLPSLRAGRIALPQSLLTFAILLAIGFITLFAWAFIEPKLMFYAYDGLGWTSSQLGLVMSVYGMAMMVGEFSLGRLSDRLGRKPVLILGLALFAAQFAGLSLFKSNILIALSFLLAGLGNALFDPALSAYMLDIAPAQHKSTIMGIKSTAGSLGCVLGPALLIAFGSHLPPQGVFMVGALSVALLIVISIIGLRSFGTPILPDPPAPFPDREKG